MRSLRFLYSMLGLLAVVAGCGDADKPEPPVPPDMSALIEAYRTPTSDLDSTRLNNAVATISKTLGNIDSVQTLIDEIEKVVGDALEPDDQTLQKAGTPERPDDMAARTLDRTGTPERSDATSIGVARQAVTLEGDGFLVIRHICDGWGVNPPIDAEANGSLSLNATFSPRGIDPIVWGTIDSCRTPSSNGDLLIDGEANLHLGNLAQIDPGAGQASDAIDPASVGKTPILFGVNLRLEVAGQVAIDDGFDFRVCREASTETNCLGLGVEFKVGLDDGTHLILFVARDRVTGGVRARNLTWSCSFADDVCQDTQGNMVTIPDFPL